MWVLVACWKWTSCCKTGGALESGLLAGKRALVTVYPTREALDPVRYISNYSSGKMGFALAQVCTAVLAR